MLLKEGTKYIRLENPKRIANFAAKILVEFLKGKEGLSSNDIVAINELLKTCLMACGDES